MEDQLLVKRGMYISSLISHRDSSSVKLVETQRASPACSLRKKRLFGLIELDAVITSLNAM